MKILIHAWARKLRNGNINPKNYPYWKELIELLEKDGHEIIQIGEEGEEQLVSDFRKGLKFNELKSLVKECDTWIGIDSFFQHLAWRVGKKGIVLFGQSNPRIFGHPENINLYVAERYFRKWQFQTWEEIEYNKDSFVEVNVIMKVITKYFINMIKDTF